MRLFCGKSAAIARLYREHIRACSWPSRPQSAVLPAGRLRAHGVVVAGYLAFCISFHLKSSLSFSRFSFFIFVHFCCAVHRNGSSEHPQRVSAKWPFIFSLFTSFLLDCCAIISRSFPGGLMHYNKVVLSISTCSTVVVLIFCLFFVSFL